MNGAAHQYVDRISGALRTESVYRDRLVQFLYGPVRERMPAMFRSLVSARHTRLLGYLNFSNSCFVFTGATKKIAYASSLDGEKVVPIQPVTALFYTATALISTYLFLQSAYTAALLLALCVTQVWRVASEVWREDYRGEGRISAYQVLALLGMLYSIAILRFVPSEPLPEASLAAGVGALWHPGILVLLLLAWLIAFAYYGRSTVTSAHLSLYVCHDRI